MATKNLIETTFEQCFNKYYYDEVVVGKLAHTEFKDGINRGDEVNVFMPVTVSMTAWDGESELANPEKATKSIAKVKIDKATYFHFEVDDVRMKQIENAPDLGQKVKLAKEYASDAVKQFAAGVDGAYAGLYPLAGYVLDNSGSAITASASNVKAIFTAMQTKFQRGDGSGHNSWFDGNMVAVIPPELEFFLGTQTDLIYTESGHKKIEKGYVGKIGGWDILVSNNIKAQSDTYYYPLFGIRGKSLAGGVSKSLHTESYRPDKKFTTCYKGYGIYGVGAPRADLLGTAKLAITVSVS